MVMHAIQVSNGRITWAETAKPEAGFGEVLIEVKATAVNRADLIQRAGNYPPPQGASDILGLECSGVIAEVGEEVSSFQVGDEVCALLAGGGHAEYVNVPAAQVLPIPKGFSFSQAASLPEVFATAYLNLFMEVHTTLGDMVLIHAGASGVGTAAIQLCSGFGNPCFITAGSEQKIADCIELGASGGTNRHEEDFAQKVLEWSEQSGVKVILDPVGASYVSSNLKCLALDGAIVVIGLMGGSQAEVPLGVMMRNRQRLICSTLRGRSVPAKAEIMAQLKSRVWPLIESGKIKSVIDSVFAIERLDEAHQHIASNETLGKVVLTVH